MSRQALSTLSVAVSLLFLALPAGAAVQDPPPAGAAESLFVHGRFAEAEGGFAVAWTRDTTDYRAALRLGAIALYANRFADADRWLGRAIVLRPDSAAPKALLAEAWYRRDQFGRAAELSRAAQRSLRAVKLEGFGGRRPNVIRGPGDVTILPFVITDPLPVVRGRVNGSDTLFFLIDTGGGELLLDTSVARAVGAVLYGTGQGVFAGGTAPVTDGRVDSVRLGDFTIADVPVRVMRLDHLAAALGGQRVDGVIGTVLLYHFLPTLDYPNDRLLLRRRNDEGRREVQRAAADPGSALLPLWLAGDHFMFARGSVNGREPVLLFVDTGLAGGGFVCSDSAARAYGIDLTNAPVHEGVGGAGPTRSRWFTVDSLSMGGITQRNIRGMIGNLQFRGSFGFEAGGIVSHQFFRPYAVTFDFDGMHILITP